MKIPKTLKIGGKKIKVKIVKDLSYENAIGIWESEYYTITLEENGIAPIEKLEECFLHEIVEAINGLYELKLSHYKITVISEVLFQILKDNKLDFN